MNTLYKIIHLHHKTIVMEKDQEIFSQYIKTMSDKLLKIAQKLSEQVEADVDRRRKNLGDRVAIRTVLTMTSAKGSHINTESFPDYFIVIDVEQDSVVEIEGTPVRVRQDLEIADSVTGEKFKISSADVVLVDQDGKFLK